MPATYEPIATTTLNTSAATIEFTSIPGTYTDLRLVVIGTATTGFSPELTFNSDTGNNYSQTILTGTGSAANTTRTTSLNKIYPLYYAAFRDDVVSLFEVDIFSYAGSTNKTCLITGSVDRNGNGHIEKMVGLWRSTSAITSIQLSIPPYSYASGTTATLYGILKA